MHKLNILHVEDSEIDQKIIQSLFPDDRVVVAADESSALGELKKAKFDLVLLDLNLKDSDGLELCQKIKSNLDSSDTPVMIVSSRSEVSDKVLGFEFGADDYVQKPFHLLELKARIKAIQRKRQTKKVETKISYGPFTLLLDSFRLEITQKDKKVQTIDLTNIEFKLMSFFMNNREKILTREAILNHVWGGSGVHVIDRTVDAKISNLRKKLNPFEHTLQSVYGVGYQFLVH